MTIELIPPKEESILKSVDKQLLLYGKLQSIYENRPKLKNFVSCMPGTKFEKEYTEEQIEADNNYVKETQENIHMSNAGKGKEGLERAETGFQLSEILQAMIVDRINDHWFKDCKAIMTAEYDDLRAGIDAVFKHKQGGYLGMSFDFTVSNQSKDLFKKLNNEWLRNTTKGKVQTVKYFEDPDTKERGKLFVPKFIVGASKQDVEDLAKAYLEDDQETLENHPFKYLMLLQIDEQLKTALEYFELNKDNKSLKFARDKYERISSLVISMKNEIHLDENINNEDLYNYTKNSIALDDIKRFGMMKDSKRNNAEGVE